jgi:hypothetical protein
MKKLTRIGLLILVIGFCLLVVTIIRGSGSTDIGLMSEDMTSDKWVLSPTILLAPRELRIGVQSNQTIDVYILDSEGINAWETNSTLKPIWTFKDRQQETISIQIAQRGEYAFLIHNSNDSWSSVKLSSTLYGFETDLLWTSIALIPFGVIFVIISLIRRDSPEKNKT